MNLFRLPEMDSVEAYMPMHISSLYLSRNKLQVEGYITVPKLITLQANSFLRMV